MKTACKKIGTLIYSSKFLSPEVALYLYKSTIQLRMEYCCHVWAGAPSCYLELLDKLGILESIFSAPKLAYQSPKWSEYATEICHEKGYILSSY